MADEPREPDELDTPSAELEHVEADKLPQSEPGTNPLAGSLNLMISVPETIRVKMVNASVLGDYEIWFFISSLLSNALVGFLVAYLQDTTKTALLAMTLVWAALFVVTTVTTVVKRTSLRKRSKEISFRAVESKPDPSRK